MQNRNLSDLEMARLREQLGRLPEPRGGRRQLHPLPTVLTIALAATLAGARGYLAISEYAARLTQTQLKRLRAYFDRTRQRFVAPSEPTFRRVLQQVDPVALEQAFSAWVQASAPADEPLAIDGKTLKGARRGDGSQTHLLAALFPRQGTVLAQRAVEAKHQASLRSRERFWDIRVPKIDSIFDNSLVPRPSWSPGVPPQHRKLVAATHRSPI